MGVKATESYTDETEKKLIQYGHDNSIYTYERKQQKKKEKKLFYNPLKNAKHQSKSEEIIINMEGQNVNAGREMIGKYDLGSCSKQFRKISSLVITNTLFEEHPRHLWALESPTGDIKKTNSHSHGSHILLHKQDIEHRLCKYVNMFSAH